MQAARSIFTALKQHLKSRGLTYKFLADKLGLSEASVKRIFSEQNCTLERLEEICNASGCDLLELIRRSKAQAVTRYLSQEQEEFLAGNQQRFIVFYLLIRGWSVKEIMKRCELSMTKIERILLDCEKRQLLELHPGLKVRLRVSSMILWQPDGPIYRLFHQQVKQEFLHAPFSGPDSTYHFVSGELSDHSRRWIKKRLDELIIDIQSLVEADADLDKKATESIGLVVAYRPWIFSIFKDT